MIDRLLSWVAPHYCISCGEIGSIFCANCKYDIISEPYTLCILCHQPAAVDAICTNCSPNFSRAWCVGPRISALENLLDVYKFGRVVAAADVCAELLNAVLPDFSDVIVTSIPTLPAHTRQRGYDHAALLAKKFAHLRGLPYRHALTRVGYSQQRGATRQQRFRQAADAFAAKNVQKDATYLLIDDIITTGATIQSAAKKVRDGGASDVWVAAVAHQTSTDSAISATINHDH